VVWASKRVEHRSGKANRAYPRFPDPPPGGRFSGIGMVVTLGYRRTFNKEKRDLPAVNSATTWSPLIYFATLFLYYFQKKSVLWNLFKN